MVACLFNSERTGHAGDTNASWTARAKKTRRRCRMRHHGGKDRDGGNRGLESNEIRPHPKWDGRLEGARPEAIIGGPKEDRPKGGVGSVAMMPRPYTPLAAANYFISSFGKESGIEHMKLQKLAYNSYGWWIATFKDDPLLNERPQVWKFGPVFNSLYHVLKPWGRLPILVPVSPSPFGSPPSIDDDDDITKELLNWVWNRYGHLSGFALSDMTHRKGTSWQRTAKEHNFSVPSGFEIPDDYIAEEFQRIQDEEFGGGKARGVSNHAGKRADQS